MECFYCSVPTANTLSCGHSLCEKCKVNCEALGMVEQFAAGKFKAKNARAVCAVCEGKIECEETVSWEEAMDAVAKEKEKVEIGEWRKKFEEIRKKIVDMVEKMLQEERGDARACLDAVVEKREIQRERQEKVLMALAMLEEEVDIAEREGCKELLERISVLLSKLHAQRFGVKMDVVDGERDLFTVEFAGKFVVLDDCVKRWKVKPLLDFGGNEIPAGFCEESGITVVLNASRHELVFKDFRTNFRGEKCSSIKLSANINGNPIMDSAEDVYVQDKSIFGKSLYRARRGKKQLEKLPKAPRLFGKDEGFLLKGGVFCFDRKKCAMRYDCRKSTWSDTALVLNGYRMVPHPWSNERVIEIMQDGSVRQVRVSDGIVVASHESKFGEIHGDALVRALCAPDGEFYILLCPINVGSGWTMFSSAADKWTKVVWPPASSSMCALVPTEESLYYKTVKSTFAIRFSERPFKNDTEKYSMSCVYCHSDGENKLTCGHYYCDNCTETFTAHKAVELMSNGEYDFDPENLEPMCIKCMLPIAQQSIAPADIKTAICAERELDWEGRFNDICHEIEKTRILNESRITGLWKDLHVKIDKASAAMDDMSKKKLSALQVLEDALVSMQHSAPLFARTAKKLALMLSEQEICVSTCEEASGVFGVEVLDNEGAPVLASDGFTSAKSYTSPVPTGFPRKGYSCAVFDEKRRLAIEVVDNDAFVTHFKEDGTGENTRISELIPATTNNPLIFDGERHVYIIGNQLIFHLDIEAMEIDMVSSCKFAGIGSLAGCTSFYMGGRIFIHLPFNNKAVWYDCSNGTFSPATFSPSLRAVTPHPWKKGVAIQFLGSGHVREVAIDDGTVLKEYKSSGGNVISPEVVVLRAPRGHYFMLVGDGLVPWRVFSSETDTWKETPWKPVALKGNTAFVDNATMTLYYHALHGLHWTAVPLM